MDGLFLEDIFPYIHNSKEKEQPLPEVSLNDYLKEVEVGNPDFLNKDYIVTDAILMDIKRERRLKDGFYHSLYAELLDTSDHHTIEFRHPIGMLEDIRYEFKLCLGLEPIIALPENGFIVNSHRKSLLSAFEEHFLIGFVDKYGKENSFRDIVR